MPNRYSQACLAAVLATAGAIAQTTAVDLSNQSREADFRSFAFTRTIKSGTALPVTCTAGDLYLLSGAAAGRSLHVCQSTNVWSLQGGQVASQEEAEYGLNDDRSMTPLKTSQAIAAQCSLPSLMGMSGSVLTNDGSVALWTRKFVMPPSAEAVTAPGQMLSTNRFYAQVTPSAGHTMSGTPTLSPGTDGQFLVLSNVSPTFSLALQDQAVLAGSGLRLGGSSLTLAPFQSVHLVYSVAADAWLRADQWSGGGGGGGSVSSVFGRSGAVNAQAGDYNASQVTNAVSTAGNYADPAWLSSLSYAKLTGAPAIRYQSVRVNTGADLTQRSRVNIVAGANVTISGTDNPGSDETTVLISAAGGGGGGGGTGPTTKTFMAAKCQNTVAGAGFSLGSTNAPTAVCDSGANVVFGVLRFTASGQQAFDSFPLPPTFAGMNLVVSGRTASTEGNSVYGIETACVGDGEDLGAAGTGGPAWNATQLISLAAKTTANRMTVGAETPLTTTGCEANELFLFRISRHTSTSTTNPELVSVSFKVQ